VERVVADLAAGLTGQGLTVGMLAAAGSNVTGVEVDTWRGRGLAPRSLAYGMQIVRTAREFAADLVHSFGETKWLVPWLALGGRCVISYQVLPRPRTSRLLRWIGTEATLVGCSDYLSRAAASYVPGRWRTVHNCVDLARYHAVREVPVDAPLVFLSRIDPIKGVHLAIEVAERSGRRLVIAGNRATQGESDRYWRDVVSPLLHRPGVEYIGPVDDSQKNELLGTAAGLIVPVQWDEPFGIVFIEALACGTPVLSCNRGALPEIVRHGVDGFLGETADDLVRYVPRLGEIDRASCRQRVESCFSAEATTRGYLKLYEELLSRQAPARGQSTLN